jgi:hypothetical protein
MQAKTNIELKCEECGGQMQYHEEHKYVRCVKIKCPERGVLYWSPSIGLEPVVEKKAKKSASK